MYAVIDWEKHKRIIFYAYVALILISGCTVGATSSGFLPGVGAHVAAKLLILFLAGLKASIVALYFMELVYAPLWLRSMILGWVTLTTGFLMAVILLQPGSF